MADGVRDIDHGYAALRDLFMMTGQPHVAVGILESSEDRGEEELTNVLLGGVHEFGREDGSIPERSWNRAYVDENEAQIREWIRKLARQATPSAANGGRAEKTVDQALAELGELIAAGMRDRIRSGIEPPLKPATERRKGSSTPLIDTAIMANSITYEVRK